MMFSNPALDHLNAILVTATRFATLDPSPGPTPGERVIENRHWGWLVAVNRQQDLLYCTPGAGEIASFFRSAAKPFQAFPLVADGVHADLLPQELAIACASHTGSAEHLHWARSLLKKAGLDERALQCGPHAPSDAKSLQDLATTGQVPGAIHNNCSGKHAAMLLYCQRTGQDPRTYLSPAHPLQQRILNLLRQWGAIRTIPVAIDGCGAPVFDLPLKTMALLYAHLGTTAEFAPLRDAMLAHPRLVGGAGRVDTVLMEASGGRLLCKVGADGVIAVSRVNTGEGLALKIADGQTEIRNFAIVESLIRIGWLDDAASQHPDLAPYRDAFRRNTLGETIGDYRLHFGPGIQ